MNGPDCEHHAPTLGLELVKGVLSHAAAAGSNKDHIVAVVEVRASSKDGSSNCLTTTTSTPGQYAAEV